MNNEETKLTLEANIILINEIKRLARLVDTDELTEVLDYGDELLGAAYTYLAFLMLATEILKIFWGLEGMETFGLLSDLESTKLSLLVETLNRLSRMDIGKNDDIRTRYREGLLAVKNGAFSIMMDHTDEFLQQKEGQDEKE